MFILLFSFCSKRESQYPRLIVPEIENVVEVNTKHMLQSQPEDILMNFTEDTLISQKWNRNIEKESVNFNEDTLMPRYDLKIIIDTSYNFHYKNFEYKWLDLSMKIDSLKKFDLKGMDLEDAIGNAHFSKLTNLRKKQVKAYPLLIFNNENSNSYLFNGLNGLQLIQEAKDEDGKWKPIEYLANSPGCIISHSFYKLKPKKYFATAIMKYHGDFKTKIRVKILLNKYYYYSNEIDGFINRSQFNDDFMNLNFFMTFIPYIEDDWLEEQKEYSLLKHQY